MKTIIDNLSVENGKAAFVLRNKEYVLTKQEFTHFLTFILRICAEYSEPDGSGTGGEIQLVSSAEMFVCSLLPNDSVRIKGLGLDICISGNKLLTAKANALELLQEMYHGADIRRFDPVYLEHMLWIDLPFLNGFSYENARLDELLIFSRELYNGISITDSSYYQYLIGNNPILRRSPSDLHNQTPENRLIHCLKIMKDHQYGKTGQYIILYNDSPIIRDGSHRAACLHYLYGNIEIKVMRLRFEKNYYSYNCWNSGLNKPE